MRKIRNKEHGKNIMAKKTKTGIFNLSLFLLYHSNKASSVGRSFKLYSNPPINPHGKMLRPFIFKENLFFGFLFLPRKITIFLYWSSAMVSTTSSGNSCKSRGSLASLFIISNRLNNFFVSEIKGNPIKESP